MGVYTNIEDKWFDLLDWFDAKKVPVYKIVDPIEGAGVPSMILFIAAAGALAFLLFGGGFSFGDGGGGEVEFQVNLADGENPVLGVQLTIYDGSGTLVWGPASSGTLVKLPPGTYFLKAEKSGCTTLSNHSITVTSETMSLSVELECEVYLAESTKITFCTPGLGTIEVLKSIGSSAGTTETCSASDCDILLESGADYFFQTQNKEYKSTDSSIHTDGKYSENELKTTVSGGGCVYMTQTPSQSGKGSVTVWVNSSATGKGIGGVEVRLVNNETGYKIAGKYTLAALGKLGKAEFTEEIDLYTIFAVEIKGVRVGEPFYNLTEDSLELFFTLDDSINSIVSVSETLADESIGPVSDANITLFDNLGKTLIEGRTDDNGDANLSVTKDYKYSAKAWKSEYNVTKFNFTGGQNVSVMIEKLPASKRQNVELTVVYSDDSVTPVSGVQVELRTDGGKEPSGFSAAYTGNAGTVKFSNVPIDNEYCAIAVKDDMETDCQDIGQLTGTTATLRKNIKIDREMFGLTVSVKIAGATTGLSDPLARIKLMDMQNGIGTPIGTDAPPAAGYVTFINIPDGAKVEIIVDYSKSGKIYDTTAYVGDIKTYHKNSKGADYEIVLVPLDTTITFNGFEEIPTSCVQSSGACQLEMGKIYTGLFSVGIPNTGMNKVNIELKDAANVFQFWGRAKFDFDDYYVFAGEGTHDEKITIDLDSESAIAADIAGHTLQIRVPVRIMNGGDSGPNQYFNYNATWIKGSAVEAKTAVQKSYTYDVTYKRCFIASNMPSGSAYTVCLWGIETETENPTADLNIDTTIPTQASGKYFVVEVTNEQTAAAAPMVEVWMSSTDSAVLSRTKSEASRISGDGTAEMLELGESADDGQYYVTDEKDRVIVNPDESAEPVEISHGEAIRVKPFVTPVAKGNANIYVYIDGVKAEWASNKYITLPITVTGGTIPVDIKAVESEVTEMSDSLTFKVTRQNSDTPVAVTSRNLDPEYIMVTGLAGGHCTGLETIGDLMEHTPKNAQYAEGDASKSSIKLIFDNNCYPDSSTGSGAVGFVLADKAAGNDDYSLAFHSIVSAEPCIDIPASFAEGSIFTYNDGTKCHVALSFSEPASTEYSRLGPCTGEESEGKCMCADADAAGAPTFTVAIKNRCEGVTYTIASADRTEYRNVATVLKKGTSGLEFTFDSEGTNYAKVPVVVKITEKKGTGASARTYPRSMELSFYPYPKAEDVSGDVLLLPSLEQSYTSGEVDCASRYCNMAQLFIW
ncbi:MAG: hypothetical protein V1911_00680, partial [Candidatus Micrarchaeota archaeon]